MWQRDRTKRITGEDIQQHTLPMFKRDIHVLLDIIAREMDIYTKIKQI